MRKITILLAFLFFIGANFANAQTRTISGKVTGASDGTGIPGVTVQVEGTTVGTVTDIDGNYTLAVPADATSLVFKYVGMKTVVMQIGDQSNISVSMETDAVMMGEVVVTALGISREKKSLGYAVSEVGSDDIVKGASTNAVNSLSGRVAGVSISQSSGNMGGSSRVLIRGAASILGNNEPLYVVDGIPIDNSSYNTTNEQRGGGGTDFGNMAQDINPDDIETVSVLKGASATALYGSRAANGVIMITTKKGKVAETGNKIGVTFNTGLTAEQVSILPDYQNVWGGGYYDVFDTDTIGGKVLNIPYYGADESWGPKMEGQDVFAWNNVYDYEQGITSTPETSKWEANPDNIRDYFRTGLAWRNNVAVQGGNETSTFKVAWTNLTRTGVYPNSQLTRNTINFNGMTKLGEKLTVSAGGTYLVNVSKALPDNGYGDNSIMQKFGQWGQRQWNMETMQNWMNPDGTQRTWNRTSVTNPSPAYSDNPYWTQYMNYNTNNRDRFFGNVNAKYDFTDYLNITGAIYADRYTDRRTQQTAVYSAAESYYGLQIRQFQEYNGEVRLNFDKMLAENFRLTAFVGGNMMSQKFAENIQETTGGLSIPLFYSLENSNGPIEYEDFRREKKINSIFGSVTGEWNNMIYVTVTGRNDWSSTLPKDKWSYFYPSVSASFVFTELAGLKDNNIIDFGQLRLNYAMVGNDTDPYELYSTYVPNGLFGGTDPMYTLPSQLNNSELVPERTTSYEAGLNMKFLKNRLGFDVTYYNARTKDLIFPVDISATSGYSSMVQNAGEVENKGFELQVYGSPIRNNNFSWDITVNFTKNQNKVLSLIDGVDVLTISSLWGIYVTASVGEAYGMLRGSDFVYDDQGRKVIGSNGRYLRSPELENLGSVLPDWNMGISNRFTYKNFSLDVLIDWQEGGTLFSTTHMFGTYTGIFTNTIGTNPKGNDIRLPVDDGGGVLLEGPVGHFDDDGNLVIDSEANTEYISAIRWAADHYSGPRGGLNTFSARYIKLRNVSFTWTLPRKWMENTFIYGASLSLYGGNLATWNSAAPHIDPEQATNAGNIQGLEGGANPSTRTFGFNLKLDF